MGGSGACQVCGTEDNKYKCKDCQIQYCSVACYKQHNQVCGQKDQSSQEEEKNQRESSSFLAKKRKLNSMIFIDEEEDAVVPRENLEKLAESEELKFCLTNPHLRDFLCHLNSTHSPRGFMKNAMQEPIFVEFADICMKVIHPELSEQEISLEQVQDMVEEAIEVAEEKV